MSTSKLSTGKAFPLVEVFDDQSNKVEISRASSADKSRLVVVYRGKHCPLCTRYLNGFAEFSERLDKLGIEVVAVSGDSLAQKQEHAEKLEVNFPIYHGLTVAKMEELGLWVSTPRSPQETDHPFAEPGLFLVGGDGILKMIDISNVPFLRPELAVLVNGLEFAFANDYPIRGTHLN